MEKLVRDRMGGVYPLDVALEVSVGYGRSWDAAEHSSLGPGRRSVSLAAKQL